MNHVISMLDSGKIESIVAAGERLSDAEGQEQKHVEDREQFDFQEVLEADLQALNIGP